MFWSSPVLTAPVLPKQVFATVPVHVPGFVYLLKTQVRGRTAICGQMRENTQKHVNASAHTHTHTITQAVNAGTVCNVTTWWRPDGIPDCSVWLLWYYKGSLGRLCRNVNMDTVQQQSLILRPTEDPSFICTGCLAALKIQREIIWQLEFREYRSEIFRSKVTFKLVISLKLLSSHHAMKTKVGLKYRLTYRIIFLW